MLPVEHVTENLTQRGMKDRAPEKNNKEEEEEIEFNERDVAEGKSIA